METLIKQLPRSKIELEIKVPFQEFNQYLERAVLELGKDIEIKGFRKGRAPREFVEKEIGSERILTEAVELAIKENYLKAISENQIEVISQPEIEVLKIPPLNKDISQIDSSATSLIFLAKVEVLPKVQLPDYKKIVACCKKNKISVTEKEIEETLKWLQQSRAKFSLKNQPAEKGDFVEIEYFSPQIENGKKIKDAFILGQGHFIPGFEEKLLGLRNGQEREEFSLVIPESHFLKDLAGKEVTFKVKMISVQRMELPELNDEFARNLGQFENLNALKKNIEEGIFLEKEIEERQRLRQEILEKISQESKVEIPEILVKKEQNQLLENLKKDINQRLNISFEDYLRQIQKTEQELLASLLVLAEKRVKEFLVLHELSKKEDIRVTDEEIEAKINEKIKYLDLNRAEKLDLEKLKAYTKEEIRYEKTLQRLEELNG